ncbi:MAG: hypothetical protein P8P83_04250 [Rickettsiaceae bacterium]|nr:hypothetical protein [Rickettsiaceae bacterium]
MKNKLLAILVLISAIILGAWYYLAGKFETQVKEVFLPKIIAANPCITADLDSVIIDKFKFRFTLKDVSFYSKDKYFVVDSDKMTVSYMPFTGNISLSFNGNRLATTIDGITTYTPDPSDIITFNKEILEGDFSNIDISYSILKEESSYLASDDQFIGSVASSKSRVSSNLKDGNYIINFKSDAYGAILNPEFDYMSLMPKSLNNVETMQDNNFLSNYALINNYLQKLSSVPGPQNYSIDMTNVIGSDKIESIISVIKEEAKIEDMFNKSFFIEGNYSLSMQVNVGNATLSKVSSFYAKNDGKKIIVGGDYDGATNYSQEQKQEVYLINNEFWVERFKKSNPSYASLDFTPISAAIMDMGKKVSFKSHTELGVENNDMASNLKIGVNDFNLEINHSFTNNVYDTTSTIKTPKMLIDSAVNFYDNDLKPLLSQNTDVNEIVRIQSLDLMMNNIRENGFDAIAVFHNQDKLEENNALVSNLVVSLSPFSIKLNDKSLMRIITDVRMQKFLSSMPQPQPKKEQEKESVLYVK